MLPLGSPVKQLHTQLLWVMRMPARLPICTVAQGMRTMKSVVSVACTAEDNSGEASLSERAVSVPSGRNEAHWAESFEGSSC